MKEKIIIILISMILLTDALGQHTGNFRKSNRAERKAVRTAEHIIDSARATDSSYNDEYESVSNAVDHLKKSMMDADSSALASLTTENLSYGHSSGLVEAKADFIKKIVSGQSNFEVMDLTEQTISISGDVAIVRHILTAKAIDNGKPTDVHLKILMVWQKQKGNWKLLARQGVKIV